MTTRSWGFLLGLVGVVLMVIGNASQSGSGSKSGLVGGGLMMGIGGILLIVGVIVVLVGLVRRTSSK